MEITVLQGKPHLSSEMKWDNVPEYYLQMYNAFEGGEGREFFKKFIGFILSEKYSGASPDACAILEGRRSVARELINDMRILDGITK